MTLPTVGKIFSLIIILLMLIVLFFFSSCGTTHAVVRTKDKAQATITITTNNPVDVTASPDLDIVVNPQN